MLSNFGESGVPSLPEGARLLHIGPMKTGTTSLQSAARKERPELRKHGVIYPGHSINHRSALGALIGWSTEARDRSGAIRPDALDDDRRGVPDFARWEELKAEIDAAGRLRVLVSHEYVSQVDDETARRIVDAIGSDRIHIAVTLRSPAVIVPSLWAQGLRDDARFESFENWVSCIYARGGNKSSMPKRFWRAYDQGRLVERWADIVGAENVTVIVTDHKEPTLLTDAFEDMLSLPRGALRSAGGKGGANRSLTRPESELFREVVANAAHAGLGWDVYQDVLRMGAILRLTRKRKRKPDEAPILLPDWAAEKASSDGQQFASVIRDSGVRVVGDLRALESGQRSGEREEVNEVVPMDVGVEALTGALIAAEKMVRREKRAQPEISEGRQTRVQQTSLSEGGDIGTITPSLISAHLDHSWWDSQSFWIDGYCTRMQSHCPAIASANTLVIDQETGTMTPIGTSEEVDNGQDSTGDEQRFYFRAQVDGYKFRNLKLRNEYYTALEVHFTDGSYIITKFTERNPRSSAGFHFANPINQLFVKPTWHKKNGLAFRTYYPSALASAARTRTDGSIEIDVSLDEKYSPVRAELISKEPTAWETIGLSEQTNYSVRCIVPFAERDCRDRTIRLVDGVGRRRLLHWAHAERPAPFQESSTMTGVEPGGNGVMHLLRGARRIELARIDVVKDDRIILTVESDDSVQELWLAGSGETINFKRVDTSKFSLGVRSIEWLVADRGHFRSPIAATSASNGVRSVHIGRALSSMLSSPVQLGTNTMHIERNAKREAEMLLHSDSR